MKEKEVKAKTDATNVILRKQLEIIKRGRHYQTNYDEAILTVERILKENKGITIDQDVQELIATNLPIYLPSISNLTEKTIIAFCDNYDPDDCCDIGFPHIHKPTDILCKIYEEHMKPEKAKFHKINYSKKLRVAFLSVIDRNRLEEMGDVEFFAWYELMRDSSPALNENDYAKIVSRNLKFIQFVDEKYQTEKVQLAAYKAEGIYKEWVLLEHIKKPCDALLVRFLLDYSYYNLRLMGAFPKEVSDDVINMVIEKKPYLVFMTCSHDGPYFGRECSLDQKVNAVLNESNLISKIEDNEEAVIKLVAKKPILFSELDNSSLTPAVIANAFKGNPSNILVFGEKTNIYQQLLADRVKEIISKLPEEQQRLHVPALNEYQARIDKQVEDANAIVHYMRPTS